MLADIFQSVQSGSIDRDIHLPSTVKQELIEFIADELPRWRDHPDRPCSSAETTLTEHLCDHLNSAAWDSTTWSHVQFRTETGDEVRANRRLDLTVKPRGAALIIEGRRHSQFDALFPIECKRLPTPHEKGRDAREYVITGSGTTGGIQRFKLGLHGAAHTFAAMIGYVQEHSCSHWTALVNSWILALAAGSPSPWSESDQLRPLCENPAAGVCMLTSRHCRVGGLAECELRHLWITLNIGHNRGRDTSS